MEQKCGNCYWEDDGRCDVRLHRKVDAKDEACNHWEKKDYGATIDVQKVDAAGQTIRVSGYAERLEAISG